MSYNADQTWTQLSNTAGSSARLVNKQLRDGEEQYLEWQSFLAGRTNAQVATALGRTETEVSELAACFAAFHLIYTFADNGASPVQADHFYAMRKFS